MRQQEEKHSKELQELQQKCFTLERTKEEQQDSIKCLKQKVVALKKREKREEGDESISSCSSDHEEVESPEILLQSDNTSDTESVLSISTKDVVLGESNKKKKTDEEEEEKSSHKHRRVSRSKNKRMSSKKDKKQ